MFPQGDDTNAKWYPYAQLIPHLPETMTQKRSTKKRGQLDTPVPRGPRPKRHRMEEDYET